jgi:serine/threonine protein kinase
MQLYIEVDMPPLRVLEQKTARTAGRRIGKRQIHSVRLSSAAVNDMLKGRRLPAKAPFLTFIAACGVNPLLDTRWEDTWDRLAVRYRKKILESEMDPSQQIQSLRAWAEQAEADNERLRQQVAQLQRQVQTALKSSSDHVINTPAPRQSASPGSASQPIPRQIGPYEVLRPLGRGATGHVYLGRSAAGRLVAIKTIKDEFSEEPGFRDRFAEEVAAGRKVSGLFTAAVVAADPDADQPWLATAYIAAPTVNRLVRLYGPLPTTVVWWLAAGCAEALESIHNAGLIHRDLKPSNVLVASDGPRVIDFGIARAVGRVEGNGPTATVGTPAFMSPEQAEDSRYAVPASDIYSLGATILFAATGHAPYRGRKVSDILRRLKSEPPDLAGLPAELYGLVRSCLSADPGERPAATEIVKEIGPLLDNFSEFDQLYSTLPESVTSILSDFRRNFEPGNQST